MADVQYIIHEAPAWRANADYLAMADLAPFGFSDMREQIWLRSLPDGGYEVCCIPFRAYGFTLGDIVELSADGKRISAVRSKGGHRAFRVFFPPKLGEPKLQEVRERIDSLIDADHLTVEWSGDRHLAVDVSLEHGIDLLWAEIQQEVNDEAALWEWADIEAFRT